MMAKWWLNLADVTLSEVHPSWLPGMDSELCMMARSSVAGRRLIANWLASRFKLFSQLPAMNDNNDRIGEISWLFAELKTRETCLLEIGAIASSDVIRGMVDRESVIRLHRLLGQEMYHRVLRYPLSENPQRKPLAERSALSNDDSLRDYLLRKSLMQLHAYALSLHGVVAERIALVFPQDWLDDSTDRQLESHIIDECFNRSESL